MSAQETEAARVQRSALPYPDRGVDDRLSPSLLRGGVLETSGSAESGGGLVECHGIIDDVVERLHSTGKGSATLAGIAPSVFDLPVDILEDNISPQRNMQLPKPRTIHDREAAPYVPKDSPACDCDVAERRCEGDEPRGRPGETLTEPCR